MSNPTTSYLFQNYNAFEINNGNIFNNVIPTGIVANESQYTINSASNTFSSNYQVFQSITELRKSLAVSVGIDAKYGFYSGSVNTDYATSYKQTNSSFNSLLSASIDCGTVKLNTGTSVWNTMQAVLQNDLAAITDATTAAEFTNKWGTHVITGVDLGGTLNVIVQADTQDIASRESLSTTLKASYDSGVNSISALATFTSAEQQNSTTNSLSVNIQTVCENAANSVLVVPGQPATYTNWSNACNVDTASGIAGSQEIWQIWYDADQTSNWKILRDYVWNTLLIQSVKNPVVLTTYTPVDTSNGNNSASVWCDLSSLADSQYYKIIGGGAKVASDTNTMFLTQSLPQSAIQQSGWQNGIANWLAVAQCATSDTATGTLEAYAIGVYDPNNLLDVRTYSNTYSYDSAEGGNASYAPPFSSRLPALPLLPGPYSHLPELEYSAAGGKLAHTCRFCADRWWLLCYLNPL